MPKRKTIKPRKVKRRNIHIKPPKKSKESKAMKEWGVRWGSKKPIGKPRG